MPNNKSDANNTAMFSSQTWRIAGVIVAAVILLGGVFAIGAAAGWHGRAVNDGSVFDSRKVTMGMRGGMFGLRHSGSTLGENRLVGVVTAVNGSTFTLSGNGVTNDITTDSSTQYQGGDSVKVNDSVVVLGNISGGKFTATDVAINP